MRWASLAVMLCGAVLAGKADLARAKDQGAHQELGAALARLPAKVFTATNTEPARFLNLAALARRSGGVTPEALRKFSSAGDLRALVALVSVGPDEWRQRSGIDPEDLLFFADYGQVPLKEVIWGLRDEDVAKASFDALPGFGFTPLPDQPHLLANGPPGGMIIMNRDLGNPWLGALGQTSVVARAGASLVQVVDPAALTPADAETIAASTTGQILLAGLAAEPGEVLQVLFLGPLIGLQPGTDPAELLLLPPDKVAETLREGMDQPISGVPPYFGLALAEMVKDEADGLVMVFAYPYCELAKAASRRAAELWSGSDLAEGMEAPKTAEVPAGAAGCAAVLRVPAAPGGPDPFERAYRALYQNELTAVRIGSDETWPARPVSKRARVKRR